jgi:DNA-binding NarL/FixJ family response regulator
MTVAPSVLGRDERPLAPGVHGRLTPREREVLGFLSEGLCPTEIADLLDIRMTTFRRHVKSVLAKLGATSRLEAVVVAQRVGLIHGIGG